MLNPQNADRDGNTLRKPQTSKTLVMCKLEKNKFAEKTKFNISI